MFLKILEGQCENENILTNPPIYPSYKKLRRLERRSESLFN